jgi:glutamate dehydrogenase
MHIFLDPDPDPEASFEERQRLFGLPRSSWTDYDEGLISEGGGVFPRTAKSIPLSEQVREMLDVEEEAMTPTELMSAMLKAEVDLLWNGGIGTYVKASSETNAEVGDRANDTLRVNGDELRCRVVGEGGNLGFTQTGRIEFALRGGRIYMDAVDNSAGVDCSDHEVNIKILLDAIVEAGDMTDKQRNELLASMTDEVGDLVLRDNYQQTQAINQALALAHPMVDVHARYLHSLEHEGRLDRSLEFLPSDEELRERRSDNRGLTAPEIAILLSYSKITTYQDLLDSDAPEDPFLSRELERYFPTPLRDRFREQIHEHRLHRQITATHVTNSLVNRCGPSFVYRLGEETGAEAPDIARAYLAAREIFSLRSLWDAVEGLDNVVEAGIQTQMMLDARKLAERATRWLLRYRRTPLDVGATISHFSDGADKLAESIPAILVDGDREAVENAAGRLVEAGVPRELAERAAALGPMFPALDITDVANANGEPLDVAAALYFALGDRLKLHWLRRHIEALPRDNRWRTLARSALRDDIFNQQAALTAEVLRNTSQDEAPGERIETWAHTNEGPVHRTMQVLTDINSSGTFDLSTLSVALREIRNLITTQEPLSEEVEAGAR